MYSVSAEHSRLRRESLGPLFVRLSVKLSGAFDQSWVRSYERIRAETDQFSRFTLDLQSGMVLLTCRWTDGDAEIHTLMQRLDLLLELANLHATLEATSEKRQSA